ncbi:permease [Anoxynatronum sibiricum]|uniref:Permease n=1 Tax=Anoxynatronum sibiricum TaxID=210623 RepID=A0ABU9VVQ7_9CLOT
MTTSTLAGRRDSRSLIITLAILAMVLLIWAVVQSGSDPFLVQRSTLENFSTIFISIVLEAFPFVLFGVFVSSLIQIFVTEDMLVRWIPPQKLPALLAASLMGLFFPICECANVPLTRRLIAKGVPLHVGITFLMSVAIMNPVVMLSTYYAFNGQWHIALLRGFLGMLGAIIIGYVVSLMKHPEKMLRLGGETASCDCGHDHGHLHDHDTHVHGGACTHTQSTEHDCGHTHEPSHTHTSHSEPLCGCDHSHEPPAAGGGFNDPTLNRFFGHVTNIIHHTSLELYAVGRFLIMGAFISSFVQTFLPRNLLMTIGERPVVSILILMALAYGLSLCSEADAFIARTFVGQFTSGAVVAFMIYGPMIDVKNTLMLLDGFQTRFVVRLIAVTTVVCFSFALLINLVGW